jgi:hypothetical protein
MRNLLLILLLLLFSATTLFAADEIDSKVRTAIFGLAQPVKGRMEVVIAPVTIAGTDSYGELSDVLYNKIKIHATDSGKFSVIVPDRGGVNRAKRSAGIIKATYDSSMNVTIDLESDNRVLASKQFALSTTNGVKTIPDNFKSVAAIKQQEAIFTNAMPLKAKPNATVLKLAAWHDSDSGIYYDGERFKIRIEASEDCYFKVYHMDNQGRTQLIFPNPSNWDNKLSANITRTIPAGSDYPYEITAPFGQDTIIVVASKQTFPNLKEEFNELQDNFVPITPDVVSRSASHRGMSIIKDTPAPSSTETTTVRFNFTTVGR